MRVLVLTLAVLAVSSGAYSHNLVPQEPIAGGSQPDAEGGQLVGFLEKLKDWMKTGKDTPAIPILDPLKKDHLDLNIDSKEIGLFMQGTLDNLRAIGLSDFVVNKGDFQLGGLQASVNLTCKKVEFFTMYNLIKAKIQPPPIVIHGNGAIIAIAEDLQVAADLKFGVNSDQKIYVKAIDLTIQLGTLDFNASGLLGDEELSKLISKTISDLVPQVLRDYPKDISAKVEVLAKKMLDQVLGKLTIIDIIGIIS